MKMRILEAMELAGQNLLSVLSPAYQYMPCWNVWIERDLKATCNFGAPQHNIGRWWDAMLRLEAATGFVIPARIEAAMRQPRPGHVQRG